MDQSGHHERRLRKRQTVATPTGFEPATSVPLSGVDGRFVRAVGAATAGLLLYHLVGADEFAGAGADVEASNPFPVENERTSSP